MGYRRAKASGRAKRTVSGYTRSDGTRVTSYMRRKVGSTRYVNRK